MQTYTKNFFLVLMAGCVVQMHAMITSPVLGRMSGDFRKHEPKISDITKSLSRVTFSVSLETIKEEKEETESKSLNSEKVKFIQERKMYWQEYLKSVSGNQFNCDRVQNLIKKYAEADWERRNFTSLRETKKKIRVNLAKVLGYLKDE